MSTGSEQIRRALGIPCAVLLTWACAPDDASQHLATASQAITNGMSDGSDPAVVGLLDAQGHLLCTGTLVAPDVVLTAAHCLEGVTTDITDQVFFGSSVAAGGTIVPVTGALVHPQFDPSSLANDLALLALASPATAAPVPLLATTPDSAFGNVTVRVVGFGDTAADAGDFGQKRTGTSTVASVTTTSLELAAAPSQQCFGDSGGPALLAMGGVEYLAGVTSHGDAACVANDYDTRVDAYATSFITPFLTACASQGCPTACDPVGAACPTGLACTNADGGIDFYCTPAPTTAATGGRSSCAVAMMPPAGTGAAGAWFALALAVGLAGAGRRLSAQTARRAFVVLWMALALAGGLNHTIADRLLGRRLDLILPQLKAGYVMFNINPRTATVYEYARPDGVRHDLADLVATPSPGYPRARVFINATLDEAFLKEICLRATHALDPGAHASSSSGDEFDFYVTEYRVDVDPRTPTRTLALHCDTHGLRPR